MTTEQVADYLDISHRTIKRYEQTGKAPKAVIECLLMIGGRCPTFSLRNDFTNWSFRNGFLWSPEGDKYTSGDVRAGKHALNLADLQHQRSVLIRAQAKDKSSNVITFPIPKRTAI